MYEEAYKYIYTRFVQRLTSTSKSQEWKQGVNEVLTEMEKMIPEIKVIREELETWTEDLKSGNKR